MKKQSEDNRDPLVQCDAAAMAPDQFLPSDEVTSAPSVTDAEALLLVKGNLWKAIWQMSWPLLLTTLAASIGEVVDVQVAGYLGASAQAAVGLAEQVIFVFMIFLMSFGVGTTAIVSRAYGAENLDEAYYATGQSLTLSVISGFVLSLLACFLAHHFIPLFSSAPDVVATGTLYLGVFALYLFPFSIVCISNAAFRAIGDSKTPWIIMSVATVVNIIGDYATVIWDWPVAGLGVKGIAASAIAGNVIAAAIAIKALSKSRLKPSLNKEKLSPLSWSLMSRVLNIGIPSAFQRMSWAASTFGLFAILSRVPNPTAALASWTIGMRIEAFLFMPMMALGLAVSSIVGQNLGAKQVERAYKAGWNVSGIGIGIMSVLAAAMFVWAKELASFLSHDPVTIDYAANYVRINAICEPFLAANTVLSGALQGAGDTKVTMWIAIVSHWLVRLPLAWLLSLNMGLGTNGAWMAMTISVILSTLLIAWRFQSGAWVHKRV